MKNYRRYKSINHLYIIVQTDCRRVDKQINFEKAADNNTLLENSGCGKCFLCKENIFFVGKKC